MNKDAYDVKDAFDDKSSEITKDDIERIKQEIENKKSKIK
jgi:hypothetical protein